MPQISVFRKIRKLLLPFSWLYALGSIIHNLRYELQAHRIYRAPVRVISVGNLSTGGTGKTPFSEMLIRQFLAEGKRPCYISRGYGRKTKGFLYVKPALGSAKEFGDEALQVASKFPEIVVAICEKRAVAIQRVMAEHEVDVIILDDAFQHRAVARDDNWVILDASRPIFHDHVLPAGNLREPLSALQRAHHLFLNKIPPQSDLHQLKKQYERFGLPISLLEFTAHHLYPIHSHHPAIAIPSPPPQSCILFSGLGNNEHFHQSIRSLGFRILQSFDFPDHYPYQAQDIAEIQAAYHYHSQNSANFKPIIITSEKDYYRLKGQIELPKELPIYCLEVRLSIQQETT